MPLNQKIGFQSTMAGRFILVLLVLVGISVCSARPLQNFMMGKSDKEALEMEFHLQNSLGHKASTFMYSMLPKGPVAPSGPSPIHNSIPLDSVSNQP